ncbi:LIM-domain binding protein-domain-containing protein [Cristinia sonorae]|uniref:LIM-domain binding protein-domain-containing protein n=1 Tax=Cristinia sonorae TaxID=1940300 RepID=A0A8K0UYZ6_9AGAR|nr:LIM-domain binding protein-domain-containing protein [Cristinia sonorae]
MNVRPDLLRNNMSHIPPSILTMNTPHLFPPQQQQPSQLAQQQQQPTAPPPHMGLLQNGPNQAPSLGLLPSSQPNPVGNNQALYQLQIQQAQRRQQQMHQQAIPQGLNPQSASGPHVNGISHNQVPGMPFSNAMMQPSLRRVPSQPLGQSPPSHLPGMHPNQPVVGGMPSMGGIPMNSQGGLSSQQQQQQLRQVQQQQQMRMQQQQQPLPMQGQAHMSPDFLHRQSHMQSSVGLQSNMARTAPTQQLLGGLAQSSNAPQSHPGMMQQSMQNPTFQNPLQMNHPQPPSQLGSSPRAPNAQSNIPPSLSSANPGAPPQSATARTRMTPDNALFFQNPQIPHSISHNAHRLTAGNNQFAFAPSSTPPTTLGDISQSMSAAPLGTSGPTSRTGLMTTPAQAFEQMNQGADHFPFTHPIAAPSQNLSQHPQNPHFMMQTQGPSQRQQPTQSLQSSPRQPVAHMPTQRPHSQPQRPHSQPQRPQSQPQGVSSPQAGPSRTPRTSQTTLPGNTAGAGSRPSAQPPSGSSPPSSQAPPTPTQAARTASRQSHVTPNTGVPVAATPGGSQPADAHSSAQQSQSAQPVPAVGPPRPLGNIAFPVGFGQGLSRLLQFSGVLASDSQNKMQLSYWDSLIKEYFTPKASLKFTLWKDNQRNEAKPFEIGVPILPRFFLVTSQSGVKSMNLSLDGARERIVSTGHAVVECIQATWTYKYTNGYTVTLRGPMTAHILVFPNTPTPQAPQQHVTYTLKFDQLQFDANYHDKLIAMEAILGNRSQESPRLKAPSTPVMNGIHLPQRMEDEARFEEPRLIIERATVPAEPVNAFGIPQATMRCLELAESVAQMSPLIQFSTENKLGPLDALTQYARKLREVQGPGMNGNYSHPNNGGFDSVTGVAATPPVTLYSNTPLPSTTLPMTSASTPNGSLLAEGASKQTKPLSMQSQAPATPNSGPANASTPASAPTPTATTTTPSMAHSTLKRKAQGGEAATSANSTPEVPPKRPNRKRGRTGG